MTSREQIEQALSEVLVPGVMRSLVGLNMIREVSVSDQRVSITLASAALTTGAQDWVRTRAEAVVEKLPGINEVEVEFIKIKPTELNQIDRVIAVMSGKGGVGKSLVASLIAVALRRQGHEVGILDADIPLTVMQTIPISGVIIVFTPQDLTTMIVRKAANMARKMSKPILGVVENMSYLYVAEIDKRIELFGRSRGEEMAQAVRAPLLGQLPIDPELAKLCDEGEIERYTSDAFINFSQSFIHVLPKARVETL